MNEGVVFNLDIVINYFAVKSQQVIYVFIINNNIISSVNFMFTAIAAIKEQMIYPNIGTVVIVLFVKLAKFILRLCTSKIQKVFRDVLAKSCDASFKFCCC